MQYYSMCGCFKRRFKLTELAPPQDVKDMFKRYVDGGTCMATEQLRVFLEESQGEAEVTTAAAKAENIMKQAIDKLGAKRGLTLDQFFFYLFSTDLNSPIGDQVHHDMTKPMSHYFIYTGHNSYLTGNQLNSDCSDKPIIEALKRGVRVIELDLWPNSSKEDIHVKHGRTLTTPVDIMTCLKSIREHAFVASPYPLVITLEDHLTPELQAKVAQMLTETFGDLLFCPECECLEELPAPEQLKYRVIISTKPPKEYLKAESAKGKGNKPKNPKDSFDDDGSGNDLLDQTSAQEDDNTSEGDSTEDSDEESHEIGVSAYKKLIAIHAGKPKGGLKKALKVDPNKVRRLSLSEQSLEKAAENHGMDTIRFTQKNILRIYPRGTRFNSSNYKPLIGWMHGAQMVAFNMQGYGKALWLMQGMFRSNGGCGYVKKPDFLMNVGPHGEVFNPKAELQVKVTLKVKVYMGDGWLLDFTPTHFDSYSPPDFYARVGIAGLPSDSIMKQTKTKNNKWKPVWDEEFEFPLSAPELALLRVEVLEEDLGGNHDFAGQTCLPVSELRQGIRAVPLFNRKGEIYNCVRLLMRFELV